MGAGNPFMFNPFEILGIEPAFEVDETLIEQRYFASQAIAHPDRFASATKLDGIAAGDSSARLNQAYEALKSPVRRAEVLIQLVSGTVPGRDGALIQDPEALAEAMELREELAACDRPDILADFRKTLEARLVECQRDFSNAWTARNTDHMQKIYVHLTYLHKVREEVKNHLLNLSLSTI